MDTSTYEQTTIAPQVVAEMSNFLTEGATAVVALHDGAALSVELPASVMLTSRSRSGLQRRSRLRRAEAGRRWRPAT